MKRRDAAILEAELETKRLALSFLWKNRIFALFRDLCFCRYKGTQLCHTATITQTTSVTKQGSREFVLTFMQPELRYHIRATTSEQRDRWADALQSCITRASALVPSQAAAVLSSLPKCDAKLSPAAAAVDFATEWLDELGKICPKNVDYATQCPKGHALISFDGSCAAETQQQGDAEVTCRCCDITSQRKLAHLWRTCSVSGCCGGYAVCIACASALVSPTAAPTGFDFPSEVARVLYEMACVLVADVVDISSGAGRQRVVPAAAEGAVEALVKSPDCGASLPNVDQAQDVHATRQLGSGADVQREHAAVCRPGHVLCKSHLGQRVCRHTGCFDFVL
jgi:hypothetical protein